MMQPVSATIPSADRYLDDSTIGLCHQKQVWVPRQFERQALGLVRGLDLDAGSGLAP